MLQAFHEDFKWVLAAKTMNGVDVWRGGEDVHPVN
jgi:hypothetical protein